MATKFLETRRYVTADEILTIDSTLLAECGGCQLLVLSPACGHPFWVAADLAEVARLLGDLS